MTQIETVRLRPADLPRCWLDVTYDPEGLIGRGLYIGRKAVR